MGWMILIGVICLTAGLLLGAYIGLQISVYVVKKVKKQGNWLKYKEYYSLMCIWMTKTLNGGLSASLIQEIGKGTVMIYGKAGMGRLLCKQLSDYRVNVIGFLDRRNGEEVLGKPVIGIKDLLVGDMIPDCIVITPYFEAQEIEEAIRERGYTGEVVTIDKVIKHD